MFIYSQDCEGSKQYLRIGSIKGRGVADTPKPLVPCEEKGSAMDGVRFGLQQASWENSSVRIALNYYHQTNTVDVVSSSRSSHGGGNSGAECTPHPWHGS
uniref:Uncharacterized protein n=1 Tax=Physcomitrium patens TaxID=3218 RepID=A0A7I3ZF45_PHYPA